MSHLSGLRSVALGVAALGIAGAAAAPASAAFTAYSTAGEHAFVVPAAVRSIDVRAVGGTGGSSASAAGGSGAVLSRTISVTPGELLYVQVGANGGATGSPLGSAAGGGGSGGSGPLTGAGGGGASDVRQIAAGQPGSLASRLLVAGGGGGAATSAAGGAADGAGLSCTGCGAGGNKGSFTGPGAAVGSGPGASGAGLLGLGGAGGSGMAAGGGGGGGYYGGSGGAAGTASGGGGGGGGASFPQTGSQLSLDATATPTVSLTYSDAGQVDLSPGAIIFGDRRLGAISGGKTVIVNNTGSGALQVVAATLSGTNANEFFVSSGCAAPLPPAGSCSIPVRFLPAALGPRTALLTVTTDAPGQTASLPLSGVGIQADASTATKAGGPLAITGLALKRTSFRLTKRPPGASTKFKRGSAITFNLSAAAKVTVWIDQRQAGRKQGNSCKLPKPANKYGKPCKAFFPRGSFSGEKTPGANSIPLPAKLGKQHLRPGQYRVAVQAQDAAKHLSPIVSKRFRVVR